MRPAHILGHGNPGDELVASLEPQSNLWRQTAGVLAVAGLEHFEDQLQQMGIPAVTLTTIHQQGHHPVVLDMNHMVIKAYEHLVRVGCRRVAFICNTARDKHIFLPDAMGQTSYQPQLLDRLAMDGPGIAHDCIRSSCGTPHLGYQAMVDLWQMPHRPDGVIISDDNIAMGVGKAVIDLHIQTPEQLQLVTQATAGVPRDFPVNFTKSQYDLTRICRGAVGLLYRLMLRDREADRLIIKATICQGSTTQNT